MKSGAYTRIRSIYCFFHQESHAIKKLSAELNSVLNDVVDLPSEARNLPSHTLVTKSSLPVWRSICMGIPLFNRLWELGLLNVVWVVDEN